MRKYPTCYVTPQGPAPRTVRFRSWSNAFLSLSLSLSLSPQNTRSNLFAPKWTLSNETQCGNGARAINNGTSSQLSLSP